MEPRDQKILILDFDGVLNSVESSKKLKGYGGWFSENDVCTKENLKLDEECLANLKRICDTTNCKIVVSSTWRLHFTLNKFKEMFAVYGWNDAPFIDLTGQVGGCRGKEIELWMLANPVTHYVIIDDCSDFLIYQLAHFVNTDPLIGLTSEDADKAIQILNTPIQR